MVRNPHDFRQMAVMSLHARQDTTVPPGGGVSDAGWIFESELSVRSIFAALHGCEREEVRLPTKWDGGNLTFECFEHPRCSSGRRIIDCHYDGQHGDWPNYPTNTAGDEIAVWFFLQHRRQMSLDESAVVV
eukprot:TRINITY_DN24158_c0_g2_i2.p2 TRINITY_DN24158_c0_g2~~TRINITY_DN24158_c0_g2_i2.p2  ORF type:complete len:131 (-),score=30.02 TRINITY_DN24158_c0_g2_i2:195-587(-)